MSPYGVTRSQWVNIFLVLFWNKNFEHITILYNVMIFWKYFQTIIQIMPWLFSISKCGLKQIMTLLIESCLAHPVYRNDDVITWKYFSLYRPFVKGIHPTQQLKDSVMWTCVLISLLLARTTSWAVELLVILNSMMLIWHHCNAQAEEVSSWFICTF